LLSDRDANEAYCLANARRQYAVYFPQAGEVTLNTKGASGKLAVRWYAIDQGRWRPAEHVSAEGLLRLKTSGDGQWAVIVEVIQRD
jgi:hypothetical protein